MIYSGSDLKFRVEATMQGFSMKDDYFTITIKNKWGHIKYTITKDECFCDSEDNFYFTVENVSTGSYFAFFAASVPDDDYDKNKRNIIDKQPLYTVDSCGCKVVSKDCDCGKDCDCHVGTLKVSYKQVWTTNVDDGMYLADNDGNLILTADGKRIQFLTTPKTDEE